MRNDCLYKQLGITAAWGKCWLSPSQSYMCVIMGKLMQCTPSLIWVIEGACHAAGAKLLTGCMDSLILALSIASVLVLALIAILLPTGKAREEILSPAQQQRQCSIYRAAAERYWRQWHVRRNRRSLIGNAQPATAACQKGTNGLSVQSGTLGPSKRYLTVVFLLYLLLWPSAASLHAIATSASARTVTVSVNMLHTGEVCDSIAQSHFCMRPRYTLVSLAPEEERSCLPNCSMPLHIMSASYTSLGWQHAPSQQEHPLVLRALRQRWTDVPETLFILPCWQIERDLSAHVEHSCLCVDLLLDINVNPRLHALLESVHSALVAIPDNRGLVLLGRTGHGSCVAMAAYTSWLMTSLGKPAILRHLHRDEWPCSSACIESGRYGRHESERKAIWEEWRCLHSFEAVWPHSSSASAAQRSPSRAAGAAPDRASQRQSRQTPTSSSSAGPLAASAVVHRVGDPVRASQRQPGQTSAACSSIGPLAASAVVQRVGDAVGKDTPDSEDMYSSAYWETRWGRQDAGASTDAWWQEWQAWDWSHDSTWSQHPSWSTWTSQQWRDWKSAEQGVPSGSTPTTAPYPDRAHSSRST